MILPPERCTLSANSQAGFRRAKSGLNSTKYKGNSAYKT